MPEYWLKVLPHVDDSICCINIINATWLSAECSGDDLADGNAQKYSGPLATHNQLLAQAKCWEMRKKVWWRRLVDKRSVDLGDNLHLSSTQWGMSLQWSLVAGLLYSELGLTILLMVPYISNRFWSTAVRISFLRWPNFECRKYNNHYYVYIGDLRNKQYIISTSLWVSYCWLSSTQPGKCRNMPRETKTLGWDKSKEWRKSNV